MRVEVLWHLKCIKDGLWPSQGWTVRTLEATVNGNVPPVHIQQLHACKYVCEVAVKLDTGKRRREKKKETGGKEKGDRRRKNEIEIEKWDRRQRKRRLREEKKKAEEEKNGGSRRLGPKAAHSHQHFTTKSSQLWRGLLIKGGGYKKTQRPPFTSCWTQEVAVSMATDGCPTEKNPWLDKSAKVFLAKLDKVEGRNWHLHVVSSAIHPLRLSVNGGGVDTARGQGQVWDWAKEKEEEKEEGSRRRRRSSVALMKNRGWSHENTKLSPCVVIKVRAGYDFNLTRTSVETF